jgi:UDP-glucose 4-epimerase
MKNKKCLVVGGAGFIGSHLVDALVKEQANVLVIDNLFLGKKENVNEKAKLVILDVCDENFYDYVSNFAPDIVYNLAVLPLPHSLVHPLSNIKVNIKIVQTLCEFVRRGWIGKMVHFSSSEVYGSAEYSPMCENHPWKASTPYAASKAAGDMICLSYVKTFDCDISIIRPFNNYGPRQNAGSYAGIIPLTINRVLNGEPAVVFGDGHQTRDYIYVKDTATAAIMMGQRDDLKGEIFNIASGHEYSMNWLVGEITKNINPNSKILYDHPRPGDVRRHIANVIKAKDKLGFEHKIPMIEGLQKTINWYVKEQK